MGRYLNLDQISTLKETVDSSTEISNLAVIAFLAFYDLFVGFLDDNLIRPLLEAFF